MKVKILNESALKAPRYIFNDDWSYRGKNFEIYADWEDDEEAPGCYVDFNGVLNLSATEDLSDETYDLYLTGVFKGISIGSYSAEGKSELFAEKAYNGIFQDLCELIPDGYDGDLLDLFDKRTVESIAKKNGLRKA